MIAYFNRFEFEMTMEQAEACSHPGPCDADVEDTTRDPFIRAQLDMLDPGALREELKEYGAWEDDELADHEQNKRRIVWLAAGNITDDMREVGGHVR